MRYKAQISCVTPFTAYNKIVSIPQCYMGISLGQPNFIGERLKAVLDWISKHSERCLLVVGDDLQRINVMIDRRVNEKEALSIARRLGDTEIDILSRMLLDYDDGKFIIARWKELMERDQFTVYQNQLRKLCKNDADFNGSIIKSAKSFVKRRLQRGEISSTDEHVAVRLSTAYLLEEITVFCLLASEGWNVEIYPGPELPVLEEIAKGLHSGVPSPLKERVNIALKVTEVSNTQ